MELRTIFTPKESLQAVLSKKKELFIGVPKEVSYQETRIALVPDSVQLLVNNGHRVIIESKAGESANFYDHEYSEAGAVISYDTSEIFKSDIILKITPPTADEIQMMKPNQVLFSALQKSLQQENFYADIVRKRITAFAFDFMKDKSGIFPVVRAMSEIAGNTSVLIAAEYLGNSKYGKGTMLGGVSGVPPTEVVIIGAGTVGEFAARSALGLGALVKVFDSSMYKLRRLQNHLGIRLYTSIISPTELKKALKTADVIIGAFRSSTGRSPMILTEDLMDVIPDGSVYIDISIDQGGLAASSKVTTHNNPVYVKNGITHYCVPNIASRVPRTASIVLSNLLAPIVLQIGDVGGIENFMHVDPFTRSGIYAYQGGVTHRFLADELRLPFKDLDLLLASF